jgi:hypothetical protein
VAVATVGLMFAAGASGVGAAPPTLTGESFHEDLPTITGLSCSFREQLGYSSTGTATGPYPGTYTETGDIASIEFIATFTIDSPVGKVTGTKTGGGGVNCAAESECFSAADCDDEFAAFDTAGDSYQATITVPGGGTFSDNGLFDGAFYHSANHDSPNDGFDSSFQSTLSSPTFVGPVKIAQCRHDGWAQFGFTNMGRCVAFVRHQARRACIYGIGPQQRLAMWSCVNARIGF